MAETGPGKHGGSRATVRKREQRKRKAARESAKPVRKTIENATISTRPILNPEEKGMEDRIAVMAYELTTLAVQLRKSLNNYGQYCEDVVGDLKRAEGVIRGSLKENEARKRKE